MKIERTELPGIYQTVMDTCLCEIERVLASMKIQCPVRKESSILNNIRMYFIEVIAPDPSDEDDYDDYGVVVDVSLGDNLDSIICNVSVARAFGPFYFDRHFEIKIEGNYVNPDSINESLDCIRSLPELVVERFKQDYIKS